MSKRSHIVHVEWRSRNIERLKQFYKAAFKWKFKDPMPGYAMADMGSKETAGGFMQIDGGSPLQPGIVAFLGADDLAAAEGAIREAGGQVVASAQPVDGWGRFSVFTDPDGNQLALWQSEEQVKKIAKQTKKAAKKAEAQRAQAVKAEKKAHKKAEKKARKAEQKAAKAVAASKKGDGKAEASAPKGNKDKKKKDKKKKREQSAEAGGAL